MSKIQVTLNIDEERLKQETNYGSLEEAINQELRWLNDSGMYTESWSFVSPEPEKVPLQTYYYTFGTSDSFPYQKGWVEVQAEDRRQADRLFRSKYPDKIPGLLNCSFVYSKEEFEGIRQQFYKESSEWHNCHDTITQPDDDIQPTSQYAQLDKMLQNDTFRTELYSAMHEGIVKAIQSDDETPAHKYAQLIAKYISSNDETRNLIDLAVSSITGWNLSTIINNTIDAIRKLEPIQTTKTPSLTEIMNSAEARKADPTNTSRNNIEANR